MATHNPKNPCPRGSCILHIGYNLICTESKTILEHIIALPIDPFRIRARDYLRWQIKAEDSSYKTFLSALKKQI